MIIRYRGCTMFVRTDEGNLTWKIDHWNETIYITKGKTVTVEHGQWFNSLDPVNAPSIPVLFRLGLIEFSGSVKVNTKDSRWYPINLTESGREAAVTLKVKAEQ